MASAEDLGAVPGHKTYFTQPISFQSYFFNGEYYTVKHDDDGGRLSLIIEMDLAIESARQFQTTVFYS